MSLRPPRHRADAPGQFISNHDSAWDFERIEADASLRDTNGPWFRYYSGATRYDLQASDVRQFIREGERPTVFILRRLTLAEYARVTGIDDRERLLRAAELGVVGVENGGDAGFIADKWRGAEDVQRAFEIDAELPFNLGAAVLNYSRPIDEAEGKRSGSTGGDSSPSEPGSGGSK